MTSRGLYILTCLSVLVTVAFPHALPSKETLVVTTGSYDDTSSSDVPTSEATEVTSEEPNAPITLTEMDVSSEISLRYASTAVVAHVHNPARRAQEYTFRVLLPETAFISGFVMILDGKPYKAYVKEKEEAKNIYNQAVAQGFGAAHVSAKARDSNIFTVSVNVEPKSRAVFNLTYEELLARRNGVYNHAVNLHPGALVPKLTVTVHIKETQGIAVLRVPEIRTGNEVDATNDDAQNQNAVIKRTNKNREATITFTPDLDEQKLLIQIYKEKSIRRNTNRYGFENDEEEHQDGTLGQFVVQYDVDRSKTNEILVNNGYFVHFFAPTSLPPLSKHVVFVLDISGSMSGRKIEQLIVAMQTILGELNKGDVFNIVQFESSVQILDIASAYERPPTYHNSFYYRPASYDIPPLLPPVLATPDNIAKAKVLISRLRAGGGTNIGTALDTAIALIQRFGSRDNVTDAVTTPKTVAQTSEAGENASDSLVTESEKQKQDAAVVESNDSGIKNDEKEPIIIFLTDGEPTEGERNPSRIIRVVAEKNYGDHKASIYSLAFGEDADKSFLRKLSLKNEGVSRHIYEASDAALQLRDFYRQISSPLVANVKFVYPPDQVKEGSMTKHKFRRFYAGSEAIVAGRIEDDASELAPHVYGICGVGLDDVSRKRFEVSTTVAVDNKPDSYLPLERLWAYLTIQQLLDERQVTELKDDDENSPAKKALALALKYEFVTSLTSLVVVKPNATSAVDTESADKASASPFPTALLGYSPNRAPAFPAYSYPMAAHSFNMGGSVADNAYPIALSGMPGLMPDMHVYEEADLVEDYGSYIQRTAASSRPAWSNNYFASLFGRHDDLSPPQYENRADFISPPQYENRAAILSHHSYPRTHELSGNNQRFKWWSSRHRGNVVTTPVPSTTTLTPLESYHLNDYAWVEPLLNTSSDCITLHTNGTQVDLKLTKDFITPKTTSGDAECPNSTDASAGRCVYLTRCVAARGLTADLYSRSYCVVGDGYAGVCCPTSEVNKIH